MHRFAIRTSVLLVLCGALVAAQSAEDTQKEGTDKKEPAKPLTLEEMLAKAVKDNPDVRVAESKVREADAELSRARLAVMQKVVRLHHEIAAHKALVSESQARLRRLLLLRAKAAVSQEEVFGAEQVVQQAKANLAKAEAELPYLLGKQPLPIMREIVIDGSPDGVVRVWDPRTGQAAKAPTPVQGTMAENIRKLLDAPFKPDFQHEQRLGDIVDYLRQKAKGVNFHVAGRDLETKITLRFTEAVPFGALAQWFEDNHNLRFVVRDYGIVIADIDHLPPGALLLRDFWKSDMGKGTK